MKRIFGILIVCSCIFFATACSSQVVENDEIEVLGNSNANITSSGFVLSCNDRIYYSWIDQNSFSATPDNFELFETHNGKDATLVSNECNPIYLNNYNDEWIYYLDIVEYKIYKVKVDGSDKQKVSDTKCASFLLRNDRIYYTVAKGQEADIYSIDLDGKNEKRITQIGGTTFNIENSYIYYWKTDNCIYQCKIDGSEEKKIMTDCSRNFQVDNGIVYALSLNPEHFEAGNQNLLSKSSTEGEKITIIPELSTNFIVYLGRIYFLKYNGADDVMLCSTDLNGDDFIELDADGPIPYNSFFGVANNWLVIMPASSASIQWINLDDYK